LPYDINRRVRLKMGMFRDSASCEIDIIKEMAEGLGSSGIRLEDILEKAARAREDALDIIRRYREGESNSDRPEISLVNDSVSNYNHLVEQAEDALRWLLIQREACGFRTHRNVARYYPIPPKMKRIES
jgi:hypothetical protein